MRWADIIAFFTSAMWLGCNVAFAIVPAVMFNRVRYAVVPGVSAQKVGELFGQVAIVWGWVSIGMLSVLGLASLVGWIVRLRRRDFHWPSIAGVLCFAAITVFTILAAVSYNAVEAQRSALEDLDSASPDRPAAAAMFSFEHERAVHLSKILTVLLVGQSLVLALSLARRPTPSLPLP